MNDDDRPPMERFKSFVSEILTVRKEDIERAEDTDEADVEPPPDEEALE